PPRIQLFEGCIEGRILQTARGTGGFGYDPVFLVPETGCTLAEFSPAAKNSMSHRAKALAAAGPTLMAELRRRA
ncbi:MAG TPA: non-canonical purine NTP pyrophosphatase, partial [Candidatus Krumholzibacteria bacterium]|nr:non-canonical purine NTP pyrophosphatase [Candidatus Krumholzibacteria bacterium]